MKTILIFIVLLFGAAVSLRSQNLFPLNVGDKWRYWEYPTYFRIVENLEETVLSNNKIYYHFSSGAYYRQAGDSVFVFDFSLNDEYLIFDFAAEVGDTITKIDYSADDTLLIILNWKGISNYFGIQRNCWNFFINQTQLIDDEISYTVADSLGITDIESTWVDESLAGAIINNVTYGNITDVNESYKIINNYLLEQSYPNPFNPKTKIKFSIPDLALETGYIPSLQNVVLKVYDILGNEITSLVDEEKSPGTYEVTFDGSNLSSGVYFYRFKSGKYSDTKKFVLMK